MDQQTRPSPTLFDLLAREWSRPAGIAGLRFSSDNAVLAICDADGGVALARVADSEPPDARIRVSADLGQTRINPRRNAPAPLIETTARARLACQVAADRDGAFLVGTQRGAVAQLGPDGELGETILTAGNAVVALDICHRSGTVAAIDDNGLHLLRNDGSEAAHVAFLQSPPLKMALSPDGRRVAVATADRLSIRHLNDGDVAPREIPLSAPPVSLRWSSQFAGWLACGLEAGGFYLVDLNGGRSDMIAGFAAPVRTLDWSMSANALIASGAFRIAAWRMDAPPFGGNMAGALKTGRSGFIAIEAIAAHPKTPLVAAGYASGRVVVSRIGAADELVVRASGGSVTALAWSADGRHLAVGDEDGQAAIITFPNHLFK